MRTPLAGVKCSAFVLNSIAPASAEVISEPDASLSGAVPAVAVPARKTSFLFVRFSLPLSVASVPDVGKVTFVLALVVNVSGFAPEVVRLPAKESVAGAPFSVASPDCTVSLRFVVPPAS